MTKKSKYKNLVFGPFLTIFWWFWPDGNFFKKNLAATLNYIRDPNTMLSFRNKQRANSEKIYGQMEGRTKGQTDPILYNPSGPNRGANKLYTV